MSRRRSFARRRRADDNKFLPKDAAAWRRLVRRARAVARAPLAPADQLRRAGDDCLKAVPPVGHRGRDSAFLALTMLARSFATLPEADRQRRGIELFRLADDCEAALFAAADPAPARRHRADIDG